MTSSAVDLLVNCAGIMPTNLVARFDPSLAEIAFKTNVIAPIHLCRLILKPLKKSTKPVIINISSIAAELTLQGGNIRF